jgi:O-methyltransferase domain/Dimerisation domain
MTIHVAKEKLNASPLLKLAFRFWESKVLLAAVRLQVFGELAHQPYDCKTLANKVGLHPRGARDFLDSLVALGLLTRAQGVYSNSTFATEYLDPRKPTYVGGLMELADQRLYPVWGKLENGLKTGDPQNEARDEADYYANLCANPARLRTFLAAMTGLSMDSAKQISRRFPWQDYASFADIGGAQGAVAVELIREHPHLHGISFDLPAIAPLFNEYVAKFELGHKIQFRSGDFFHDPLPHADVLILGHVLHNWGLEEKMGLIQSAYSAVPCGGVLLVYDAVIDDDRNENAFALLMSLNMLLVTPAGSTYTAAECMKWMKGAGFRSARAEPLSGADSLIIATK